MTQPQGWIGVDLDGTLAVYTGSIDTIGDPVPLMLERVRTWIDQGREVRIFTARARDYGQCEMIRYWLRKWGLPEMPVTDRKDFSMAELWDDRCHRVEMNTGVCTTSKGFAYTPTRDLAEQVIEVGEAGGDMDAFIRTIPPASAGGPKTLPSAFSCATFRYPGEQKASFGA